MEKPEGSLESSGGTAGELAISGPLVTAGAAWVATGVCEVAACETCGV